MKIAVAKGDGIGPEIMDAVLRIFEAAKVPLEYDFVEMGKSVFLQGNSAGMTEQARATTEDHGILFKGPMETPKGKGVKSINVTARKTWNTYANKRVFKSLNGVDTVHSKAGIPIDMVIVRENIEDTYGGIEHMLTHDVALCRRFITVKGSEQVHRYAFEMAKKEGRKKVTCGHKANIMKITDGTFLKVFYDVAKDYPEIEADDKIVDDLAMKLVSIPDSFDVVVLPNLQGDIISDLCAGLVGGLGFAPSSNIGDFISIFEAVHGTAPDITGMNKANPTSLLLSGVMMLKHLGLSSYAYSIENALYYTLEKGFHTADFGNDSASALSTSDFTDKIIENLGKEPSVSKAEKGSDFMYNKIDKPSANRIIEAPLPKTTEINGADLFIESNDLPKAVGDGIVACLDERFECVTISNRGTQIWPTGSLMTDCINQYRVRIERKDQSITLTQDDILELSKKVSGTYKICTVEFLMSYDGERSYSLAQGQ